MEVGDRVRIVNIEESFSSDMQKLDEIKSCLNIITRIVKKYEDNSYELEDNLWTWSRASLERIKESNMREVFVVITEWEDSHGTAGVDVSCAFVDEGEASDYFDNKIKEEFDLLSDYGVIEDFEFVGEGDIRSDKHNEYSYTYLMKLEVK
jgi:hypothetical protein